MSDCGGKTVKDKHYIVVSRNNGGMSASVIHWCEVIGSGKLIAWFENIKDALEYGEKFAQWVNLEIKTKGFEENENGEQR